MLVDSPAYLRCVSSHGVVPATHSCRYPSCLFPRGWLRPAWLVVMSAIALVFGSPGLRAQSSEQREAASDPNTFLYLKLPKAQALTFYRAWTQANSDLENGRIPEARRGFATVLSMLDEMEAKPALRERALLAKAHVHARVLGDRMSAKRELARVLTLNPKSEEALRLDAQLKSEEGKPRMSPEVAAPPVELVPRTGLRKEGTP